MKLYIVTTADLIGARSEVFGSKIRAQKLFQDNLSGFLEMYGFNNPKVLDKFTSSWNHQGLNYELWDFDQSASILRNDGSLGHTIKVHVRIQEKKVGFVEFVKSIFRK